MNDEQPNDTQALEGTVVEATATATAKATAAAASAIVLRAGQEEFDHKQLSTLALISPGLAQAPRGHLAMFFHYCIRTGLDPFARQIYMIGRTNWKAADNPDEPEKTWTIQTGIDGFRAVAHRAAKAAGEVISYEDTVYYDFEGKAHDVWLSKAYPAAVKVTVLRGTARFPFIARWDEFAPTYYDRKQSTYVVAKMWQQMPAHMLRKCAEAGALRMAAPQDLSGVYVDEEMEQADAEAVAGVAEDAARRLREAAGLEGGDQGGAQPAENTEATEATEDATDPAAREEKPTPRERTRAAKPEPGPKPGQAAEADKAPPARKRAAPQEACRLGQEQPRRFLTPSPSARGAARIAAGGTPPSWRPPVTITAPQRPVSLWPAAHAADARRPRSLQTKIGASDTVCARRAGYLLHGYTPTDLGEKRKAILGTYLHAGMLQAAREEYGWIIERRVEDDTIRGHIDAVQLDGRTASRLPKRLRPSLPAEETTVEDIKTKSTFQWDTIVRYGASDAEIRQVLLYADLLRTEGFAAIDGQRQLARLGPLPVGRIRFRFLNRDSGDDHVQEMPFHAERARGARWWVQQVRAAETPEDLPRTYPGPGLSAVCDNCPFRTACWGQALAGRRPQSMLIHDDAERERALAEYVEVSEQIKPLRDRLKVLRAKLDGAEPGVYGDNVLSWSGGNPAKADDVDAMAALYRRAGLPVPMAPDAAAMKAQLKANGIPVPVRLDHERRTAVSINVTARTKP